MHPVTLEYMVKEKQRELQEEARIIHLRKSVREPGSKIRDRVLLTLGDLLVSLGHWLIQRYSPVVKADVDLVGKCNGNSCA